MKLTKSLLITFLLFLSITSYSQNPSQPGSANPTEDLLDLTRAVSRAKLLRYDQIKGTPYSTETYQPTVIEFGPNKQSIMARGRINYFEDNLELLIDGKPRIFDDFDAISKIVVDDESYVVRTLESEEGYEDRIMKLMEDGECELLVSNNVIFKEAQPQLSTYSEATPASFDWESEQIFLKVGSQDLVEVKSRRRFFKDFQDIDEKLVTLAREKRYKFSKIEDLKELVSKYNSP